MKSMASAIIGSTGPEEKFPKTIFLSINAGINQKLFAVHVWLKIDVSLKALHRMRECTLGDL